MDLMDDPKLRKSVLDQMLGETEDVTANALKKPAGPVKGVEIAITVSPKTAEELPEVNCGVEGCDDPAHNHPQEEEEPERDDYIGKLMREME